MSEIPSAGTPQANKALVRQFIEQLLNHGNEDFVRGAVAPGFVFYYHVRNEPFTGYGALFQAVRALRNGFPDFRIDIKRMVAEEDAVMTFGMVSGTYNGRWGAEPLPGFESMPATGLERVPPTGKRFEVEFFSYATVADGKVSAIHTLPNAGEIPLQVGIMPSRVVPLPLIWILRVKKALGRL